jgi:ADP-heptose:LPS heptosyltransferase
MTTEAITLKAPLLILPSRYLGDTILSIPLVVALRRMYPQVPFHVLVEPQVASVWACYATSLKLTLLPYPKPKGLFGVWHLAQTIAKHTKAYDAILVLKKSLSSALLARLIPAKYRVGFSGQGRAGFLHRHMPYPTTGHEIERLIQLLRLFHPSDSLPRTPSEKPYLSDEVLCLYAPDPLSVAAKTLPVTIPITQAPWWCIQPFTSNPRKDWHPDALLTWLQRSMVAHPNITFAFIGSHQDGVRLEALFKALPLEASQKERVVLLAGKLSFEDTWHMIQQSACFIGADSVGLHMAASVGVPCVALFGPSDETQWHPWAWHTKTVTPQTPAYLTEHRVLTTQRPYQVPCRLSKQCPCNKPSSEQSCPTSCMAFTDLQMPI